MQRLRLLIPSVSQGICANQPSQNLSEKNVAVLTAPSFLERFCEADWPIPKQSNSTVQIQPPPWLNLRRKPELDLLPLEVDFLYGLNKHCSLANGTANRQNSGRSASDENIVIYFAVPF